MDIDYIDKDLNDEERRCMKMQLPLDRTKAQESCKVYFLLYKPMGSCYVVREMQYRTPNVLQYRDTPCESKQGGETTMEVMERLKDKRQSTEYETLFRKQIKPINCRNTFDGNFAFNYQVDRGSGGICRAAGSEISSCQEPGTPWERINQRFYMRFNMGTCGMEEIANENIGMIFDSKMFYSCLGSWLDENENNVAAISSDNEDRDFARYRCILTRRDEPYRMVYSRTAECKYLKGPYDGPVKLNFLPKDVDYVKPMCNFPKNVSGNNFVNTERFDSKVIVNDTHMHFKSRTMYEGPEFEYYYVCRQQRDSRYLVTYQKKGGCDKYFICLDLQPRHHNILRYRVSMEYNIQAQFDDGRKDPFSVVCAWRSFGQEAEWRYRTMILDPPYAVECPIAGRYIFKQTPTSEANILATRERETGVTVRPRPEVPCNKFESDFASCRGPKYSTKQIAMDVERCMQLDWYGKPRQGDTDYDKPDYVLNCAGYWREDGLSFLITYEEEDSVSRYRCWVYERTGIRSIQLSRGVNAKCIAKQTAASNTASEGVSIKIDLEEFELLYDDCPMRYYDARNPYIDINAALELANEAASSFLQSHLISTLIIVLIARFVV